MTLNVIERAATPFTPKLVWFYYLPMTKSSRLVVIAMATSLLWFGLATAVSAQTNPPMASEQRDRQKESLFNQITEYRRSPNPDQQRLAYPTAKAYLRQFGGDNDRYAKEVQKFVDE